ncbi:MAG: ATP-binding cassette domain-containing protein [Gemmatimonadota bacterium]
MRTESRSSPEPGDPGSSVFALEALRHTFRDGTVGLAGLDLAVPPGRIVGILGSNGSGKSTLLHLLATTLKPTAGRLHLFPSAPALTPRARRRRIATVFEVAPALPGLSGRENIIRMTELRGASHREAEVAADRWLDRFGLGRQGRRALFTYSFGMRRKVALAEAFAARPRLLLLDEPLIGLDFRAREVLAESLRSAATGGTTAVLALHDAEFARRACDRVILLHAGCSVADGPPDRLIASLGRETVFEVTTVGPGVLEDAPPDPIRSLGSDGKVLRFTSSGGSASLPALAGWLTERGVEVRALRIREPNLEDLYVARTGISLARSDPGSGGGGDGGRQG